MWKTVKRKMPFFYEICSYIDGIKKIKNSTIKVKRSIVKGKCPNLNR